MLEWLPEDCHSYWGSPTFQFDKFRKRSYGALVYFWINDLDTLRKTGVSVHEANFPVLLMFRDSEIMNLYSDDDLFPHIEGTMLKDKRRTLVLAPRFGKKEMPKKKGEKSSFKVELFFADTGKTALISPKQLSVMMSIHGGDPGEWGGKKVVIYAEYGTWFKKKGEPGIWALRVDEDETIAANVAEILPPTDTGKEASPDVAELMATKEQYDEFKKSKLSKEEKAAVLEENGVSKFSELTHDAAADIVAALVD